MRRSKCRYVADLIRFGAVWNAQHHHFLPHRSNWSFIIECWNLEPPRRKSGCHWKGRHWRRPRKPIELQVQVSILNPGFTWGCMSILSAVLGIFLHQVPFCSSNTLNAEFLYSVGFGYKHSPEIDVFSFQFVMHRAPFIVYTLLRVPTLFSNWVLYFDVHDAGYMKLTGNEG
jgi:hypothetical protein